MYLARRMYLLEISAKFSSAFFVPSVSKVTFRVGDGACRRAG